MMRRFVLVLAATLPVALVGCGKKPFRDFTSTEGGFTVQFPGTPRVERRPLDGATATIFLAEPSGGVFAAGYADFLPGTPVNFDAAVEGMAEACEGKVLSQDKGFAGDDDWVEFEIESGTPGGYVSGRLMMIGSRFYVLFAAGKVARRSHPETRAFIDSFKLTGRDFPWSSFTPGIRPPSTPSTPSTPSAPSGSASDVELPGEVTVKPPEIPPVQRTPILPKMPPARAPRDEIVGFSIGNLFRDTAPTGGILVGFDLWYQPRGKYEVICAVRPIYRVGTKNVPGLIHGNATPRTSQLLAPTGYAVGAVSLKAGIHVEQLGITYMKVDGDRLNPEDVRLSHVVGGSGILPMKKLGSDGTPVTGIQARTNRNTGELCALGLVLEGGARP